MKKVNDSQTKKTAVAKKPNSNGKVLSKVGGINDMTETEARNAIKTLKGNICSLMQICYQLETRKGYVALGYTSFKECVANELVGVVEYDYAIKLKNAGQVHMSVCPEIPMGEVSEGVLRKLYRLTDAKRKSVRNTAVKKFGDFRKVTEPMLKSIIESKGFAEPAKDGKSKTTTTTKTSIVANDPKHILDPKIILKAGLQKEMRLTVLELLKKNTNGNKFYPASKEYFEEALSAILDDLFDFLCGHYESLYPE